MQDKAFIRPLPASFIELQSVDSTNNYALSRIRDGQAEHGSAYFAHEQTAGKGQRGRNWASQKGANIALSIALKPQPLLVSEQFQLSACVAVAVQKFFSRYAGTDTKIKWPNDLYWQDRKAGGILIESIVGSPESGVKTGEQQAEWKWAVAGIGININQTEFASELLNPVSLKQITGRNFDTVLLAKELYELVKTQFTLLINEGFQVIYKEYNDCLYKRNEPVKLKKNNAAFVTTVKGVSTTGQLITQNNNLESAFEFGEVAWII